MSDERDPYQMVYCDSADCRVNTFERGKTGKCPYCRSEGIPVQQ